MQTAPAVTSLNKKAEDNLQYIRESMERATSFTALSGKAYVAAGVSALIAAWLAEQQVTETLWLAVWMVELLAASCFMLLMMNHKAMLQGQSLLSVNGKKLLFAFVPAMSVGGVLTLTSYLQGDLSSLPGIWLSLYGAAVMTAGAYSVAVVPTMGALFLLIGAVELLITLPPGASLALGMGGLHIVFGIIVWRNYGG